MYDACSCGQFQKIVRSVGRYFNTRVRLRYFELELDKLSIILV